MPSNFARLLDAIDAKAGAWKDLTAHFVQEKHSPLLRRPLVSRGMVKAKGTSSIWEATEPELSVMTVDPKLLRIYYPKQKVVEEYGIVGKLGMLAASPVPRLATIRQTFTLVPDDGADLRAALPLGGDARLVAVRMNPASKEIAQFVDHVRVLLDTDRGLVLVFELLDPDGERTVIRFTDLGGNTGLRDEDLILDVPRGVKVVRPLDGVVPSPP